jgi:hypothetical protein
MNHKSANSMKSWQENGNTTTLLFFSERIYIMMGIFNSILFY